MATAASKIINQVLQTRELRSKDGARLTIRKPDGENMRYLEIFTWGSDVPNEVHFAKNTLIESDVELPSVAEALKTACINCINVSLEGPPYEVDSPQPLSRLFNYYPGDDIYEIWTQGLRWKFLQKLSLQESQSWQSLTTLTLDLTIDIIEDQACFVEVLAKGHLKRFLAGLKTIEHLGLFFYSNLPSHSSQFSHGPLEHILDTQLTWPHLRSLRLNGFDSTAQELIHLLVNQSATLRAMKLHNYLLLSESWLRVLPKIRDSLHLSAAEVAGVIEGGNEFWLVKIPGQQENCFLAKDLASWLTNPRSNSLCPLTKENMARDIDPQEHDWE